MLIFLIEWHFYSNKISNKIKWLVNNKILDKKIELLSN